MAKKRAPAGPNDAAAPIPNVSLSRAAKTGKPTEDELLLERPKQRRPVPRVPSQAEFTHGDPWRTLRIMGEYVHAFDALAEVGAAVSIFGSARTPESDPIIASNRLIEDCRGRGIIAERLYGEKEIAIAS